MARVYKCTIHATHSNGTLVQPSCHYQTDVGDIGSEPNPDDVARLFWQHIATPYLTIQPTALTVHELIVTEEVLKPAIGVVGAHLVGLTGFSATGADATPLALVPLVNLHTQTHSRSARGWQFLGSLQNATHLDAGGNWEATTVAAIQDYANKLAESFGVGDVNVTTCKPVIYSRTRHQRGQSPFVFPVSSAIVNPRPTWLRSRRSSP